MKHISIDYHFVCDHVAHGSLRVSHISSKDRLVDALTKPLSSHPFQEIRSKIVVSNESTVLWGHVSTSTSTMVPRISPPFEKLSTPDFVDELSTSTPNFVSKIIPRLLCETPKNPNF